MKGKTLATRGLEVLALAMIGEGIVGLIRQIRAVRCSTVSRGAASPRSRSSLPGRRRARSTRSPRQGHSASSSSTQGAYEAVLALLENRPALATPNRGDARGTSRSHAADVPRRNRPWPLDRVSGYNLPDLFPENGFNVARALAGSEGTLVTILEATLHLIHNPKARTLLVLGYTRAPFRAGLENGARIRPARSLGKLPRTQLSGRTTHSVKAT